MKILYVIVQSSVKKNFHKKKEDDPHYENFKLFYDEIEYKKVQELIQQVVKTFKNLKPQADKSEI